jgi:4-amino-4-deoxy-L-arabinose transferase-like glycosyltransferase
LIKAKVKRQKAKEESEDDDHAVTRPRAEDELKDNSHQLEDESLVPSRLREDERGDISHPIFYLLPFAFCLFLVALGVRLLAWQDVRFEPVRAQYGVTANYKFAALALMEGGPGAFLSRTSPLAQQGTLGHPPGYPFFLALAYELLGDADETTLLIQVFADAAGAVVLLLIAAEFVPRGAAIVAGLLAAVAPQFIWNAVQMLPDALAVLPILLAVYLIVLAMRRPRVWKFVLAGALVGLSCWLRANAMLLAPFLAVAVVVLFGRGVGLRYALALVAGAVLTIAPLTIRNAWVFGHFVPVSLGAGQTLLEGIGDYDAEGRLGIPATDTGIQQMEAARYGRPEYATDLFGPDAIRRERARLALGWSVIRSHPFWFAGVMAQRAASMLRLERTPRVSTAPPASDAAGETAIAWSSVPRLVVANVQKLFITAVFLPLYVAGLVLLWREGSRRALVLLLAVPVYYLCVQSALHTEYRYVMAMHYFLFVPAAASLYSAGRIIWNGATRLAPRARRG